MKHEEFIGWAKKIDALEENPSAKLDLQVKLIVLNYILTLESKGVKPTREWLQKEIDKATNK
jgi:hypothetical protein